MKRCEGPDCEVEFEPKRSTAKYHSATCRQRAGRAAKAAAAEAVEVAKTGTPDEHGLVRAVRVDLEGASAVDTVAGQLALQLARRIAAPDASGIGALSKELRSLIAEAKGETPKAEGDEPTAAAPDEEEDELEKARRRREEARQAAGLS